jgi:hypothetical protein
LWLFIVCDLHLVSIKGIQKRKKCLWVIRAYSFTDQ